MSDYNLGKLYPNLAQVDQPTKNRERTSFEVNLGSGKKVWWRGNRLFFTKKYRDRLSVFLVKC